MTVGIIGAGKVGTTLGAYLSNNQVAVSGFYSRTYGSAVAAADFTETKSYKDIYSLVQESNTFFIATPDGEIGKVWECISGSRLDGKIVCHFSGSLSSQVFSGIETAGAFGCSIHPMFAFSDKFQSFKQFSGACLTIEGQQEAVSAMRLLFESLGHQVFIVRAEDKMKYHAAAAFASNYMIGLYSISLSLLAECGFSEEDSRSLLGPLVRNNVDAMLACPLSEALTGPVERGDTGTVKEHLRVLHGRQAETVYRSIGKELLMIAEQKNPGRDYTALKNLL